MAPNWWKNYQLERNTEKIYDALREGDTEKILKLLPRGVIFTARRDLHLISYAIVESRINPKITPDIILAIADAGLPHGSLDKTDFCSATPLSYAARVGSIPLIQGLLDRGAKIQESSHWTREPLESAAWGGHEDAFFFLLGKGAVIKDAYSLLLAAVLERSEKIFDYMLKNPDLKQEDFTQALSRLIDTYPQKCDPAIMEKLLKAGADPNARNNNGDTPLHALTKVRESFSFETALLFLKAGAIPTARNNQGKTPFQNPRSGELRKQFNSLKWYECADRDIAILNHIDSDTGVHIKEIFNFRHNSWQEIEVRPSGRVVMIAGDDALHPEHPDTKDARDFLDKRLARSGTAPPPAQPGPV